MFRSKSSKPSKPSKLAVAPQCKKHPKHHQSPGVCSLCLTEKLLRISNASSRRVYAMSPSSSSSSSSSPYSSDVSSCGSPVILPRRGRHNGDPDMRILGFDVIRRKSRSLAFVNGGRGGGSEVISDHHRRKENNNEGTFLKFLRPRKMIGILSS
ncbi:hypothetical protein Droror1_Dr00011315 [Drosera rotundifolia]